MSPDSPAAAVVPAASPAAVLAGAGEEDDEHAAVDATVSAHMVTAKTFFRFFFIIFPFPPLGSFYALP